MPSNSLIYYTKEVVKMMNEKYNIDFMQGYKMLVNSKTYKMLEDLNYSMWDFGAPAIFEIWECERITGEPKNSVYIRCD